MYAGTVARLEEPADEPLSDYIFGEGYPPALVVEDTQATLDDRPVQTGMVAGAVEESVRRVDVGTDDGEPWIDVRNEKTNTLLASEWVAEVTGSGIVVSQSVGADDEELPFPFNVFSSRCGSECRRMAFDIQQLAKAWRSDNVLADVWMLAAEDEFGDVSIDYGEQASLSEVDTATIGLGFKREYQGSVDKGIVFRGGYAANYRDIPASVFVRFVQDELLPFAYEYEPKDAAEQVDFDSFGGG
jgi:hypothetical protein